MVKTSEMKMFKIRSCQGQTDNTVELVQSDTWFQSTSVNKNITQVFRHPVQSDIFPWSLGVSY
jgi:hypothetical protein